MGSIMEYVECEKCPNDAIVDFNYNTGEEFKNCSICGAGYTHFLIRDEENNPIRDKDGKLTYKDEKFEGNGVAHLMYKNNVASVCIAPNNKEERVLWLKDIFKTIENDSNLLLEECYVTEWSHEKDKLYPIYGTLPYPYSSYFDYEEDEIPF